MNSKRTTKSSRSGQADDALVVNSRLTIPRSEFRFSYVRSSGPGGQNVNKVNTKVRLRWPVAKSPSVSADVKERFLAKYRRRITSDGVLVLTSQRFRDRHRNVDDCLEKLRDLLAEVARPRRARKATKVPRRVKEQRLREKRAQSAKKQLRRTPPQGD